MNYWKKSFGYYLLWPALGVYTAGLIAAIVVDCFTIKKMRKKIVDRIILVGELNEIEEEKEKEKERLLKLDKSLLDRPLFRNGNEKLTPINTKVTKKDLLMKNNTRKKSLDDSLLDDKGYHSQNEKLQTDISSTSGKVPKKKKKIIRKKKVKKIQDNFVSEEEKEGGENDLNDSSIDHNATSTSIKLKMPREEEKTFDIDNDTGLVKSAHKKKITRKKKVIKKKENKDKDQIENFDTDALSTHKSNSKSKRNKKSSDSSKEDTNSKIDEDDANSHLARDEEKKIEEKEKLKTHKVPTTIDIFEHNRNYWMMMFYSNTFVNVI